MRTDTCDPEPVAVLVNHSDMANAARAYLLAISYPSDGTEAALAASLAPGAQLPRDTRTLEVLRRSNWRYPACNGRTLCFRATQQAVAVSFGFDTDSRLERVNLIDLTVRSTVA